MNRTTKPKPPTDIFPDGIHRRIYALLLGRKAVSALDLVYLTNQPSATRRLREVRQTLHEHGWDVQTEQIDGIHRYSLTPLPGNLRQETLFP